MNTIFDLFGDILSRLIDFLSILKIPDVVFPLLALGVFYGSILLYYLKSLPSKKKTFDIPLEKNSEWILGSSLISLVLCTGIFFLSLAIFWLFIFVFWIFSLFRVESTDNVPMIYLVSLIFSIVIVTYGFINSSKRNYKVLKESFELIYLFTRISFYVLSWSSGVLFGILTLNVRSILPFDYILVGVGISALLIILPYLVRIPHKMSFWEETKMHIHSINKYLKKVKRQR